MAKKVETGSQILLRIGLFAVAFVAFSISARVLIGLVALPFLFRLTGRRARDAVTLIIPIWNAILVFSTLWRLTAGHVYWSPRGDLTSRPIFFYGTVPGGTPAAPLRKEIRAGDQVKLNKRLRLDGGGKLPAGYRSQVLSTDVSDGITVVLVNGADGRTHWVAVDGVEISA